MDDIAALLKGLRFRKKILGGVDERDVWKKLEQLQREYRAAFEVQQERSRALLADRDMQLAMLREQLTAQERSQGDFDG